MSRAYSHPGSSGTAWLADVICGAFGGYAVLGMVGSMIGISFMVSQGEYHRRQRLSRERQRRELRYRHRPAE